MSTYYYEGVPLSELSKSVRRKVAAAGLAGSMALGGGAAGVKAMPKIRSGIDTARYAMNATNADQSRMLASMRQRAKTTGKTQTNRTLTRQGWIDAGRPSASNGGWRGAYTRGSKDRVYQVAPNGSIRSRDIVPGVG